MCGQRWNAKKRWRISYTFRQSHNSGAGIPNLKSEQEVALVFVGAYSLRSGQAKTLDRMSAQGTHQDTLPVQN